VYIGEPSPYSVDQEIYIELIPVSGSYINSGIWQIIIEPIEATTGEYFLYMPTSAIRTEQTRFYRPTPEVTLTIPSTAVKVITVGSYDLTYNAYADFSGRGYADQRRNNSIVAGGIVKPDLAAPGVDIIAPDIYGGYQMFTGSSFATPLVSGSAALLMEWGIVRGNDPYLYAAKVKAYLRAGAKPIRGETDYPNGRVGFGALCLEDSLPI
ncbi:MAG: S8 family serine peptidase, partial [Clostridium sp.]|nr:S8 family serine peptidase [Clostridium sp.]